VGEGERGDRGRERERVRECGDGEVREGDICHGPEL